MGWDGGVVKNPVVKWVYIYINETVHDFLIGTYVTHIYVHLQYMYHTIIRYWFFLP